MNEKELKLQKLERVCEKQESSIMHLIIFMIGLGVITILSNLSILNLEILKMYNTGGIIILIVFNVLLELKLRKLNNIIMNSEELTNTEVEEWKRKYNFLEMKDINSQNEKNSKIINSIFFIIANVSAYVFGAILQYNF